MNKIMTNREYIIKALTDGFDDWGISESAIVYNIACPYYTGDKRAKCHNVAYDKIDKWEHCRDCKYEWLDSEVDE